MWTDFNYSFTFGFVDKLRNMVKKSSTAPEFCCLTTTYLVKFQFKGLPTTLNTSHRGRFHHHHYHHQLVSAVNRPIAMSVNKLLTGMFYSKAFCN